MQKRCRINFDSVRSSLCMCRSFSLTNERCWSVSVEFSWSSHFLHGYFNILLRETNIKWTQKTRDTRCLCTHLHCFCFSVILRLNRRLRQWISLQDALHLQAILKLMCTQLFRCLAKKSQELTDSHSTNPCQEEVLNCYSSRLNSSMLLLSCEGSGEEPELI